jgi:hypothetical protein
MRWRLRLSAYRGGRARAGGADPGAPKLARLEPNPRAGCPPRLAAVAPCWRGGGTAGPRTRAAKAHRFRFASQQIKSPSPAPGQIEPRPRGDARHQASRVATTKKRPFLVIILGLAWFSSGCSGSLLESAQPTGPEASGSASPFGDRMRAFFSHQPATTDPGHSAGVAAAADCPGIEIRPGASTYSVGAGPGGGATPTTLRYQAVIANTARECAVQGGTMTIKVGVQGRIILGPAGGPGQLDVPMRIALVKDSAERKTVWTKLYRVAVSIPPGQTNVPFVHIEENMSFPLPATADLDAYVIYIGYDPAGSNPAPGKKRTDAPLPSAQG